MIIGLDVGGTHTDAVLLGNEGLLNAVKVPTDADDLFATVVAGLEKITAGLPPDRIRRLVLSTTLTTNAIVENRLPAVGMIVSSGPGIDPDHFRIGGSYHVVSGSIDHRGREVRPLDDGEIDAAARRMEKGGIRNVGVVTKFSVRNPAHELRIARRLGKRFERVFCGHRISGSLNFPRRIATTYLNAAVCGIHRRFYEAVARSLEERGLRVPIRILKSDGGTMSLAASMDLPSQTILSGPAASVMGAIAFAPEAEETLLMDIGGTTTDMAVLVDQAPLLDPLGVRMGPYRTLTRSLETLPAGIGGDSRVRVTGDRLELGPDRAGPAMAYGGPQPTPTDALAVLGMVDTPGREAAARGLAPLAEALGRTVAETAERIFEETCRRMLDEAGRLVRRINAKPVYTVHELLEDHRVAPKQVLLMGAPAPHFAARMETLSDLRVGVIPRWKVANALGAALARTTCQISLHADSEQGFVSAPAEGFFRETDPNFSRDQAVELGRELLREKAVALGADPRHLETEIIEDQQFNMVRGFRTTGRNIRLRLQVKPGLIHGYDPLAGRLI